MPWRRGRRTAGLRSSCRTSSYATSVVEQAAHLLQLYDDRPRHLVDRAIAVDLHQALALRVVGEQRSGALLIDVDAVSDHLGGVVGAAARLPARDQPFDQGGWVHREVYGDLYGDAEVLRDGVRGLGLLDSAREPVQHIAARGGCLGDRLAQHGEDEVVRDQVTALHVRLSLAADVGAVGDVLAQQVSAGDVGDVEVLRDSGRLGALSGTRRTDQQKSHGVERRWRGKGAQTGYWPTRSTREDSAPATTGREA